MNVGRFPVSLCIAFSTVMDVRPVRDYDDALRGRIRGLGASFVFVRLIFCFPMVHSFLTAFLVVFVRARFRGNSSVRRHSCYLVIICRNFREGEVVLYPRN